MNKENLDRLSQNDFKFDKFKVYGLTVWHGGLENRNLNKDRITLRECTENFETKREIKNGN